MKKILSCVLCLIMMLSMGTVAFADTNDFVLTYSNEASYEITIPESGDINVASGKGTITIGVTEANLEENTVVKVTASSTNYADDSWYLVNTNNSSDKIAYTIGTTDGGSNIASGSSVLSADSATSTTLYVTVSDTTKVGTFTDTITFTSEIISLINFTIGSFSYRAEEGMTWVDWIGSEYDTPGLINMNNPSGANENTGVLAGSGYPLTYSSGATLYMFDEIVAGEAYTVDASSVPMP